MPKSPTPLFTFPSRCSRCYGENPTTDWMIETEGDYLHVPLCAACKARLVTADDRLRRTGMVVAVVAAVGLLAAGIGVFVSEGVRDLMLAILVFPAGIAGCAIGYAVWWVGTRAGAASFASLRRYGVRSRVVASAAVGVLSSGAVYAVCVTNNWSREQTLSFTTSVLAIGTAFTWRVPGYFWAEAVDFVAPHFRNRRYRADFLALNAAIFDGPDGPKAQRTRALRKYASDSVRAALLGIIMIGTIAATVAVVYFVAR